MSAQLSDPVGQSDQDPGRIVPVGYVPRKDTELGRWVRLDTYALALFVHIIGVVVWFGGLTLLQRGGLELRRAETAEQAQLWLRILRPTGRMFPIAGLFLLASGLFMAAKVWTFTTSWVLTGIITLVILLAVGGGVVGRRLARIGALAVSQQPGPIAADLKTMMTEPSLWILVSALNGAAIGLVWLMTNKPGWAASIGTIIGLSVVGAILGSLGTRRPT